MAQTAYDAILANLAGAAKIRADTSHQSVVNAQYLSQMRSDFLKSMQASPVANPVASNPTRDLAMSVMDKITPHADQTFTPAPTSSGHGFGSFLKHLNDSIIPLHLIEKGVAGAVNSGAGKAVVDALQRPVQGVGAAMNYEYNNPKGGFFDTGALKAFGKGLTDKSHILPGEVIANKIGLANPTSVAGKIGRGAVGLTGDIALDPLNFVPVGKIGEVAKGLRGEKAIETAADASDAVKEIPAQFNAEQVNKTGGNVLKSKAREFLDTHYKPIPDAVGKELVPFQKPRFASDAIGAISDAKNPVDLAHQAISDQLSDAVLNAPKLAHPGLDIPAPFKDVSETTTERVPKLIHEDVPIAKKAAVAKAASAVDAKTGRFRAIKMMLLQSPNHTTPNGLTIGHLLSEAKTAKPSKLADIKSIIHKEAVRIFNEKDTDSLEPIAKLRGRSGNVSNAGITLDQATHLFTHGKIPHVTNYDAEGTDEFLSKFPIASKDDLKNLHLTNSNGHIVSLHDYLKDYNMPVHSVSPTGEIKQVIVPKSPGLDFGEIPQMEDTPLTKKVAKTVYENITSTKTSQKGLTGAEKLAWQIKHTKDLTPEEAKYISATGLKPSSFASRVAELKLKQVAGNFKTLHQFVASVRAGEVPDEFLTNLYRQLGVKNIDDLEEKATSILKKTGPAKVEKPAVTVTKDNELKFKAPTELDKMKAGVETPAQIIDKVSTQGPEVLAKHTPELSPAMQADVNKALQDAVRKNLTVPQDKRVYGYKSNKGTLRTEQTLRQGVGRNLKGWNAFSQGDALSSLITSASSRLKEASLKLEGKAKGRFWAQRAEAMYNMVMPELRTVENTLAARGVKIIAGKDESGILMSTADVLESLPRDVVKKYLFAPPIAKYATARPTGIINAAEPIVTAALHDGNITLAKEAAFHALMDPKAGGNFASKGEAGINAARDLVGEIVKAMPTLLQRVNENYAEHSIKVGQSVTSMTDQVIADIMQKVADPNVSAADAFSALMGRGTELQAAGDAVQAPGDALSIAKVLADSGLAAKGIQPGDLSEANLSKKIATGDKKTIFNTGVLQQKSRVAEAVTIGQQTGEEVTDVTEYMALKAEAGLFRSYVPLMGKVSAFGEHLGTAFKTDYGYPDMHDALWGTRNTNMSMGRAHRSLMSTVSKYVAEVAGTDARAYEQEAFKLLQQGGEVTDEKMTPIMNAMKDSIDLMFTAGEKSNASLAIRNGLFPEHLNKALDYFGAPKSMRFHEDIPMNQQANIWRSWENVDDPLDALDKVFAGYQFALTDSTVGRTFSDQFGSVAKKEGYVKIGDKFGKSILHKFIDSDLYYPEEIAKQIPYYDAVREAATKGIQNKNLAYVVHLYDTFTHGLKTGLTVVRPGHHVSNAMGDMILNMLAGVTNPLAYRRGMRVLAGRSKMYSDWDGLKALHADTATYGAIPGKGVRVGRIGNMTDDEVWRAAYGQGLLGDFHQIQDLDYNDAQQFNKLAGTTGHLKAAGRGYLQVAGKTADFINHNIRMTHFIDVLNKTKAKTLNEAIDEAGKTVRHWHPDGSDLTPFERKYVKRTILFYSWMKKSSPLILQSLLQHPGRVLALPKATYQFAQIMGMNPDSLADPFPQGSLFPSFVTDNILGPQFKAGGKMMGLTLPGDPISSTIDQQINHPIQSLLSGITPVAKVPLEVATGKNLATGVPITDKSDYIDSQIPLVSTLSNILNKSVTGGGAPQNDVAKGSSKPGMDDPALINFLTGAGLKDYSKPGLRKSAIYELRDKYKKQAMKGRN